MKNSEVFKPLEIKDIFEMLVKKDSSKSEKLGRNFPGLIHKCLLREKIFLLSEEEQDAVVFRFWELMTIEEIAIRLRLTWDETDELIKGALDTLRGELCRDPRFSLDDISRSCLDPETSLLRCC